MAIFSIASIDLTPYQAAPMLPAEATVTLGFDLYGIMPGNSPPHVHKAGKRMYDTASELQQVFVTRVELAGVNLRMQMNYDTVTDRFWGAMRQQFSYWMNYEHEGLLLLSEAEQQQIDLVDKREKAELARDLDKHLFSDGLKFLGKPFNQQVALMASRLEFIASSDNFNDYEELIGADLLNTLNVLQGRYEAMVRERSAREDDGLNIRQLRHTLQRHITLYASAVLTMLDEDDPNSADVVLAALRPMVNVRTRKSGSNDGKDNAGEPEGEGQPVSPDMLEGAAGLDQENGDAE